MGPRVLRELDAALGPERAGPRRERDLTLAANLASRLYEVRGTEQDRAQALSRWTLLAGSPGALGCDARAHAAELSEAGGARAEALTWWRALRAECPSHALAGRAGERAAALTPPEVRARAVASLGASGNGVPRYRRVVLDAGHGGYDPGARGPTGLRESEVTLDVTRRLAELLASAGGAQVVLTRDADEFVALDERAARANRAQADLFLSIHCNSSPTPDRRGISTYVLDTTRETVLGRVARREEASLEVDPASGGEVFGILAELRLAGHDNAAQALAARVQQSLLAGTRARWTGVEDMGVHAARFNVLVGARMPALLVELSFVSNPTEEARLRDPRYRDTLAQGLAQAILSVREGAPTTPHP